MNKKIILLIGLLFILNISIISAEQVDYQKNDNIILTEPTNNDIYKHEPVNINEIIPTCNITSSENHKEINKKNKQYDNKCSESVVIDTDFKENYKIPLNTELETTVFVKDVNDKILNKSGEIHLLIIYQRSGAGRNWPWKTSYGTVDLGNHSLKNGVSKFKYLINSSAFDVEYIPLEGEEAEFNYEYYDKETNNEYVYKEEHVVLYPEDMKSDTFLYADDITGYAGQKINFNGSVFGDSPVKSGHVTIKLNGRIIKSDVCVNDSGNFNYEYRLPENFSGKYYTVTYFYDGTDDFWPSNNEAILKVLKNPVYVIANNVSVVAGQKVMFKGKVLDVNNKSVKTGRIVIKLNGKTVNNNITLNKKGEFRYSYKVPNYTAKKYKLTYVYVANNDYARYKLNRTFTIKNQASKITVNNITGYRNSTVKLKVKVIGAKTGLKAMSGKVGLKLNGKVVKVKGKVHVQKIKNGLVVFKYKIPEKLKAGKYNITVTYSGGRNLLAGKSTTAILTVKTH